MGFFDSLKKAAKAVSDFTEAVNNATNGNQQTTYSSTPKASAPAQPAAPAQKTMPAKSTKSCFFDYADEQSKPEKNYIGTMYDNDADDMEMELQYSFMISEDFNEISSGALEIDVAFLYRADEFDFSGNYLNPHIALAGIGDRIIDDTIAKCEAGEAPDNVYSYLPITNMSKHIKYKAKLNIRNEVIYIYGMNRGTSGNNCYVAAYYATDAIGTQLEVKLMSAVDRIAQTYTEALK